MNLHIKRLEMGQEFSVVLVCRAFTGHLLNFLSLWGSLFIYYLMLYVCMHVFVCYKKGSITFDPNNATFTQKIDYTGRVMTENGAELSEKSLKMGSCHYEILHFAYRR